MGPRWFRGPRRTRRESSGPGPTGGTAMPDSRSPTSPVPSSPARAATTPTGCSGTRWVRTPCWLLEWLCERLPLTPGMRVLDLGCGKAMTSVFLAKEFDARVYAVDLWMDPDHNWRRVVEAGVGDRVCPMRAEAHALPFAAGFFDAIVSIDAFQYFGTDVLYLDYLARFLRPGGLLGVVVPGLRSAVRAASRPGSPSRSRTARSSGRTPAAASSRPRPGGRSGRARLS